jgi:transposase
LCVRCEVKQERRERCRGQLRGRRPTVDAIRNGEELAAAGYARVAPSTFADKSGAHGVDEPDARVECGVVVTPGPTRLHQALSVPGVDLLTATALIATAGDARQFKSGRELNAWLGLVRREHSSGERTILVGLASAA